MFPAGQMQGIRVGRASADDPVAFARVQDSYMSGYLWGHVPEPYSWWAGVHTPRVHWPTARKRSRL
jgi:hypothetical protein